MSNPNTIGTQLIGKNASAVTSLTAAGSGDNTAVVGVIFDRQARGWALSAILVMVFTAVLAAGKKLTLKSMILEHGDDSALSDAATLLTLEDSTGSDVAVSAGGGTVTSEKQYSVPLAGAKRYIRLTFTPDLNAANTDTANVAAALVMGGENVSPAV